MKKPTKKQFRIADEFKRGKRIPEILMPSPTLKWEDVESSIRAVMLWEARKP